MELKGIENKTKRAIEKWKLFEKHYKAGMEVEKIGRIVKKKNGKPYSRQYIYRALQKLDALRKEGKI
jgi:geranylgeranyl pyrophosphate synthase